MKNFSRTGFSQSKIPKKTGQFILLTFLILSCCFLTTGFRSYSQATQQPGNRTITGVVTDTGGKPLPGVTVLLKGTTTGTITDTDGEFSLVIPSGAEFLQFSFVGMRTQDIPIEGKTTFSVTMEEDIIGMEEVVVVGYGTQKKINLTGSIDVVSGEQIQNRSAAKVDQLIKGTTPNLAIQMGSYGGEPGAESSWRLRGYGSISGDTSPLVLVDGVEMDLGNVDPESIESFSILKDASASAIYGSRAPFGVILITTKSGKKGEGVQIQYSTNQTLQTPIKFPSLVDALTWVTAYNQANANAGLSPVYPDEMIDRIKRYMDGTFPYEYNPDKPISNMWAGRREGNANYDWPQIMIKDFSYSQKHNINVSGGDSKTQYYISGGLIQQEGLYNWGNDEYRRYNFLSNFSSEVTDWLTFKSSLKYAKGMGDYPDGYTTVGRQNLFVAFLNFAPMMPMYNINGTYQAPFIRLLQDCGRIKNETNDFFITLGGDIEPVKDWITSLSYNHNIIGSRETDNPHPVYVELGNGSYGNIGKPESMYYSTFDNTKYTLVNVVSSYEKIIGNHFFKLLGGYEQEDKFYSRLNGIGTQVITDAVPSISTSLGEKTVTDNIWHWSTQGVFGRFNYNYMEKYLLEFSARYNGSSRFAKNSRWGLFPSASAGYNISREKFWAPVEPYINLLKIRGSYGSLGNQNVSNYLYLSRIPVYPELSWILDNQRPPYAVVPSLISDNLTWETITTINLGFDAGFLNHRLEINFDWYDRITTDMLGPSITLPYTLGASTPQENNAELETRGFEVILSWKDRLSSDFSYHAKVSLGDSKSTILKYMNEKGLISTWYEGKEVGEIWGYTSDGLIQEAGEPMNDQSYFHSKWGPGDIKYKDLNGDGKINPGTSTLDNHGDLSVIGNTMPRYNFGFTAGLNWKGIDFTMFWNGIGRREFFPDNNSMVFWGLNTAWGNSALHRNSKSLDYWRPADETNMFGPNTDSFFPKPYFTAETNKNRQTQTRYLLNAAYLRLQNLQLGYTLPARISNKVFIRTARIYFSGENLLTFAPWLPDNIEPETAVASTPSFGGYNSGGVIYPISTTLSLGLNLTF